MQIIPKIFAVFLKETAHAEREPPLAIRNPVLIEEFERW